MHVLSERESEIMTIDNKDLEALRALNDEVCWRAVTERDARFDGMFVYGVLSTKVFCKPSCPSRRPKRKGVRFFASHDVAEAAGFRACLRCQPKEAINTQTDLVQRACCLIEENLGENLSLEALAKELEVSPFHLQRTFKKQVGVSPRKYAEIHRVKKFKELLKEGESITDAIYEAGFGSSSRLYEKSNSQLGMTPSAYSRGGKGMKINYTVVECSLGNLLVAATERGICSIAFGDTEKELEESLRKEFPRADIGQDKNGLSQWVMALLLHLEGRMPRLNLPLDVQATVFQQRVWEELRRIPYGETRSYSDIARSLDQPTVTRAVARACATNPAALVTPCHRVVREDGSLSGYRWGIERKKKLLDKEREEKERARGEAVALS